MNKNLGKEIKELKKQIVELEGNLLDKQREFLHFGLKELFEKYPRLINITASGYVPAFNDGDACTFRQTDEMINGFSEWDDSEDEENENENLYEAEDDEAQTIVKKVKEFLRSFDDKFWEKEYESNFRVTFTREGESLE